MVIRAYLLGGLQVFSGHAKTSIQMLGRFEETSKTQSRIYA